MIIVAGNEKAALRETFLSAAKQAGIEAAVPASPPRYGDYVLILQDRVIGIERKTISDLVASMIDGRAASQAEGLRESFDVAYILLEGTLEWVKDQGSGKRYLKLPGRGKTKWPMLSILNKIAGLQLPSSDGKRLGVMMTSDYAASAAWILGFYQMLSKKKIDAPKVDPKAIVIRGNPALNALVQVEGLGAGTADRMLQSFGTIRSIITATDAELKQVAGVGPKTIENIRKTFGEIE